MSELACRDCGQTMTEIKHQNRAYLVCADTLCDGCGKVYGAFDNYKHHIGVLDMKQYDRTGNKTMEASIRGIEVDPGDQVQVMVSTKTVHNDCGTSNNVDTMITVKQPEPEEVIEGITLRGTCNACNGSAAHLVIMGEHYYMCGAPGCARYGLVYGPVVMCPAGEVVRE